jgi:hypothetical protein
MKRSGDRVIGGSGDREGQLSAPPRLRGEIRLSDHSIARFMQTFRAVLREIFDESAYDRFLLRTQRQRSIESYRAFMIERDAAAATKPRCC